MSFYHNTHDMNRGMVPRDVNENVYFYFFNKHNIDFISSQITSRLQGVHPEGKNIIVPYDKIISVMDSIYQTTFRDVDKMTMMTISYITDYIRNEFEMERQNNNLSIWVNNRPSEYGMERVPQIKLREKSLNSVNFMENY